MNRVAGKILAVALGLCTLISYPSLAKTASSKGREMNWSINITKKQDSLKLTLFNLGIISNIQNQRGLGINVLHGAVHAKMSGFQFSGLLSYAATMNGLQLGGLANFVKYDANGVMFSGLVNANGGRMRGIQLSGLTNISGNRFDGLALSGLMNVSTDVLNGMQLSTLLNVSGKDLHGVQTSLLSNVGSDIKGVQASLISNITANSITGLQLGGVANIAFNTNKALQLSTLTNVCLSTMHGMQFALGNYAENVQGMQLGLVNLSTGKVDGWQVGIVNHSKDTTAHKIGLVNITPRTRIQAMIFGSNTSKINVAVRFKNRQNYSILGIGTHYFDMNDDFSGCLFYRTGLYYPLFNKFELSGDLGYFHIENFENDHDKTPERLYSLQARVNLSYQLFRKLSIFATTGYAMTRHYKKNKLFENKGIIEFGVILF